MSEQLQRLRPKVLTGRDLVLKIMASSESLLRKYLLVQQIKAQDDEDRDFLVENQAKADFFNESDELVWYLRDAGLLDHEFVGGRKVVTVGQIAIIVSPYSASDEFEPPFKVDSVARCVGLDLQGKPVR